MAESLPVSHPLGAGIAFGEAELREWQLTLMTSPDAARRLESFRRLLLSQASAVDKLRLALLVAADSDITLAREGEKAAEQRMADPTVGPHLKTLALDLCPGPAGRWLLPPLLSSSPDDEILELAARQLHHGVDAADPTALSGHLIAGGARALAHLIRHFPGSRQPLLALNVMSRILERLDPGSAGLAEAWDFAVETLRSGPREALPLLLEFPLGRMAPSEIQRRLWLRELLLARSRLSSEHLLAEVDRRFHDAGSLALEVLLEAARSAGDPRDRHHALRLGAELTGHQAEFPVGFSDVVAELLADPSMDAGELILARGRLWCHPAYPPERLREEVQGALASLWRKSRTLERLQALALAAGRMEPPQAAALLLAVQDLFSQRLPRIERNSIKRPEFLDGTAMEEDFLVAGLEASAGLFLRQDIPEGMVRSLAELLTEKWGRVGSGRVLWGPAGTRALIRALSSLARSPKWETAILASFAADPSFVEVQRALIVLWPRVGDAPAAQVASFLHGRLAEVRTLEPEELEVLLELARVWIEGASQAREGEALRLCNRVLGSRRHAQKQVEAFAARLQPPSPSLAALVRGAR